MACRKSLTIRAHSPILIPSPTVGDKTKTKNKKQMKSLQTPFANLGSLIAIAPLHTRPAIVVKYKINSESFGRKLLPDMSFNSAETKCIFAGIGRGRIMSIERVQIPVR
jgi:hypothetical protein